MSTLPDRLRVWSPPILLTLSLCCVGLLAWAPLAVALTVGIVLTGIAFAASGIFIVAYKPWLPHMHGRAGRHLLAVSYCLLALTGLVLVHQITAVPLRWSLAAQLIILAGIAYVTCERVLLLFWERRHRKDGNRRLDHI